MAKQGKKKNNNQSRRRRPRPTRALNPVASKHRELAHLLADPCGAPTSTGIYPGEKGMVERFIGENFIVGPSNTCGFLAFHPNTGWFFFSNNLTGSAASAATFGSNLGGSPAPGNAFLSTNAQKVRGLGACIQAVCSTLSITNITGEICMGVVSADTLALNGTITVDTLFTVLQARSALTRDIKEVKWFPATFDNRYSTYVSGSTFANWQTTGTDYSDTNIIVVAVRNVPAGTVINLRLTWVCEWTPKPLLGLTPNPNSSAGVNHLSVVSAMEKAQPSWWHNLGNTAMNVFSTFANQAMHAVGNAAGNKLNRYLAGSGPIIEELASLPLLTL
jgi:hypothetical protein